MKVESYKQIRFEPETLTTRQKILIALAVAFVAVLVVGVLGAFVVAGWNGWKTAQRAGNEAATIQNLKTIAAVETQYFNTHDRTYAMIDQLVREQMLTAKFAAHPPIAYGYVLTLELPKPTAYTLRADPVDRSSGTRHFYLDSEAMQIHRNPEGPAGSDDPLMESK